MTLESLIQTESSPDLLPMEIFDRAASIYDLRHADMPLLRLAWVLATGPSGLNVLVVDEGRDYTELLDNLWAFCRELKPLSGYQKQDMSAAALYHVKRRRPNAIKDTYTQFLVMALDSPAIVNQSITGVLFLWHLSPAMLGGPHWPDGLALRVLPAITESTVVYRVR